MTIEWIETSEGRFQILFGYGRLQKARSILYRLLPDSIKLAQIANPDATDAELLKKASVEETIEYRVQTGIELAKLVLNQAPDWDKEKVTIEEYVDGHLPADVGDQISDWVRVAVEKASLSQDQKKDSS